MFKIDFPIRIGQTACSFLNQPKLPKIFGFSENNSNLYPAYRIAVLASPIAVLFRPKWDSQIIATVIRVIPTFAQQLIHRWNPEKSAPTNEDWVGVVGEIVFSVAYISSIANPILLTSEKTVRVALYVLASAFMSLPLLRHYVKELSNNILLKIDTAQGVVVNQIKANIVGTHRLNSMDLKILNETIQQILNTQLERYASIIKSATKIQKISTENKELLAKPSTKVNVAKFQAEALKHLLVFIEQNINSLKAGNKLLHNCLESLNSINTIYKQSLSQDNQQHSQKIDVFSQRLQTMINAIENSNLFTDFLPKITRFHTSIKSSLESINAKMFSFSPETLEELTIIGETFKPTSPNDNSAIVHVSIGQLESIQSLPSLLPLEDIQFIQNNIQTHLVNSDTFNLSQQIMDMEFTFSILYQNLYASLDSSHQQILDLQTMIREMHRKAAATPT